MTKKFWNNWQTRIGETKNIQLFNRFEYSNGTIHLSKSYGCVLTDKDRLIKASFHGDAGDLVIERHRWIFGINCNDHYHVENEYLTLHRNEIASIEFIKYLKKFIASN